VIFLQEEVENRSVTLIISGTKLTARVLRAAISKYLVHRKENKAARPALAPLLLTANRR
jgi:hypothetical protein